MVESTILNLTEAQKGALGAESKDVGGGLTASELQTEHAQLFQRDHNASVNWEANQLLIEGRLQTLTDSNWL